MSNSNSTEGFYNKAQRAFVSASGKLQTILSADVAKDWRVNMPPETSMFHIIKPSSIPEPTVATTSGATFLSSLSLIRAGSIDGVSIIGHIKNDPKIIGHIKNDQLKEIEMEFVEADQTAAKSEKSRTSQVSEKGRCN